MRSGLVVAAAIVSACGGADTTQAPCSSGGLGGSCGETSTATVSATSSSSGGAAGSPDSTTSVASTGGSAAGTGGSGTGAGGDSSSSSSSSTGGGGTTLTTDDRQRAFIELRFGMFIHFGILTYTGKWAQGNLDITQFKPGSLNPKQWAQAAASAKMKFGVLTTRHHDGFALWPSKASNFNVGHIPWRNGQGDVVKEYVDAFRAEGLLPAFYYSIWDTTHTVGPGASAADVKYVKTQLTELLSNYGPIPLLVFDGWSWMMGHRTVAFNEIHDLVKSLQPDILIVDHDGIQSPWDADLVMYEEPRKVFSPAGNTFAAVQGNKINRNGGNDWFWSPTLQNLMTVTSIVTDHLKVLEPRYTNFILNCPPNRDGLMDSAIVQRLAEVGNAWTPNLARPPLPAQDPINEHPYMAVKATATSGTAFNAIDARNDLNNFSLWQSSSQLPQSVTLDLGSVKPDVAYLGYVPPYAALGPIATGAITSYQVSVSTDGAQYTQVGAGTWPVDGKQKVVVFGPTPARYVRLTALKANGGAAAATEVTVGGAP